MPEAEILASVRRCLQFAICAVLPSLLALGCHRAPTSKHGEASAKQGAARLDAGPADDAAPTPSARGATNASVGARRRREEETHAAFRRAQHCFFARMDVVGGRNVIAACEGLSALTYAREQYRSCSVETPARRERLKAAEAVLSECGGDDPGFDEEYFQQTRKAASLGDADAQICYLAGAFGEVGLDERNLAEMKRKLPIYIQDALRRGDWRVLQVLAGDRYVDTFDPIGFIGERTPLVAYKANRLLRLAATGDYAASLDAEATYLKVPRLSSLQVTQAKAWARQAYHRYFRTAPQLLQEPTPCAEE
jgi:hypothetical protein